MIAPGGVPEVALMDREDARRMAETFSATDVHMRDAERFTVRYFEATDDYRAFVTLSVDGVTVTHRQWQGRRLTLDLAADHQAGAACYWSVEQARALRDQLTEILDALDPAESLHDYATRRAG